MLLYDPDKKKQNLNFLDLMCAVFVLTSLKLNDLLCPELEKQKGL